MLDSLQEMCVCEKYACLCGSTAWNDRSRLGFLTEIFHFKDIFMARAMLTLGPSLSVSTRREGGAWDKRKTEARQGVREDKAVSPVSHSTWGVWWYQRLPLAYQHVKCLNSKHSVKRESIRVLQCAHPFRDRVCAVDESCDQRATKKNPSVLEYAQSLSSKVLLLNLINNYSIHNLFVTCFFYYMIT